MKSIRYAFLIFLLLGVSHVSFAGDSISNDFDFSSDWQWDDLMHQAKSPMISAAIGNLRDTISLEDAHFILYQLSKLNPPTEIYQLSEIEKEQAEWGGGFYSIIPDYFQAKDSMIIPDDFAKLIESGLALALIRKNNYEIISDPNFNYPLKFSGTKFKLPTEYELTADWNLQFDFSFLDSLLNFFDRDEITFEQAETAASNPAVIEMLKHRRSLGYVPEPLPDTADMAKFIFHAASRKPADMIWKWLNPWNDFCMADIFMNRNDYAKLLNVLKSHQTGMAQYILGRMHSFAPVNINFSDQISLLVNWGIRSWATEKGLGTNIVQFKDDYPAMFRSLTHETFHRLQLRICPVDTVHLAGKNISFEDLVYYDFPSSEDRNFYEAITYVMLEGSATYVGGVDSTWNETKKMQAGMTLLDQLYKAIYVDDDLGKSEELLNQGLKSNGPFYGLGYYMSKQIVEQSGKEQLGKLLQEGSPAFFQYYQNVSPKLITAKASFDDAIMTKIDKLAGAFDNSE